MPGTGLSATRRGRCFCPCPLGLLDYVIRMNQVHCVADIGPSQELIALSVSRVFAALLVAVPVALAVACGSADEYVYDESEQLPTYAYAEAIEHVGERATVCGDVHGVAQREGDATYLVFGKTYPNQVFAVIVEEEDRSSFPADLGSAYNRKAVCASGVIEVKGRAAEMTVRTGDQITLQP